MNENAALRSVESKALVSERANEGAEWSCTVVVPVRNEAGNVGELLDRIPIFGRSLEVILVEGGSSDDTWNVVLQESKKMRPFLVQAIKQQGRGKRQALIDAASACRGDLLFILDGDLSVDPEVLSAFYRIIQAGEARFLLGTRFRVRMEPNAMRLFNYFGNRGFALLWSWLLKTPVSDSLCGTKVFFRDDFFGGAYNLELVDDPFGDFSLLLGAALLELKTKEVPVCYRARRYGKTNIRRWRDGWILFRFVLTSAQLLRARRRP